MTCITAALQVLAAVDRGELGPDDTQVSGSCRPYRRQRFFVIDFSLPEKCCQLNEVEQASVELVKDWSHVVCNKPAPVHSTCVRTVSRRRMVSPVTSVRDLGICRPEHENSRAANRVVVFHRTPSVATDSPVYSPATFQTLAVDLVLSRLDYSNSVLV